MTSVLWRQNVRESLKNYYELSKPRIVALLIFTTVTAMFIATGGVPSLWALVMTIIGGSGASAGASALNQYLDREMDARMHAPRAVRYRPGG